MNDEGYINLAAAILRQAVKDYQKALLEAETDPSKKYSALRFERFFLSDWGQLLSIGHGELIIEKARKEVFEIG